MGVRAKFRVSEVKDSEYDSDENRGKEITLYPVTGGSGENESFFKYTPAGHITLSIVNPAAAEQFTEGAEFYVDFTPAE